MRSDDGYIAFGAGGLLAGVIDTLGISLDVEYLDKLKLAKHRVAVTDLLGGPQVLGSEVPAGSDPLLWDTVLAYGMPVSAIDALRLAFRASRKDMLGFLAIRERSIQRKGVAAARLNAQASARVLSVARLIEQSIEVFGSPAAADRWLCTPNQVLGGSVPLQLAAKTMGGPVVLDTLNSIEHGMFA